MATGKKLGEAYVEIRARMERLKKDLATARGRLDKFVQQANAKLAKVGEGMTRVGRSLTLAISLPLAGFSAALLKFAADAEESENLFRVSMGNMADAAQRWSTDLQRRLGVSAIEARKTIGVFNNMTMAMGFSEQAAYDMSTQLVELGHDMASFFNIGTEEAFQKLQAGIVGEIEPLRRLGIVLSEATIQAYALEHGITENAKAMTEAEKVQARFGVIMERTKNAQGDLMRTSNSFTNQLRRFYAEVRTAAVALGTGFLPAVTAVLKLMNQIIGPIAEVVGKFFHSHPIIAGVTAAFVALAIALPPVIWGLGQIAIASSALIGILPTLAAAASVAWKAILGPIGWIVAGITAITTAYFWLTKKRKADAEAAKVDAAAVVAAERKKVQDLLAINRGTEFASAAGEGLGLFGRAAAAGAAVQANPFQDRFRGRQFMPTPRQIPNPNHPALNPKRLSVGDDKAVTLLQQAVDALRAIQDQTMTASLA